MEAEAETTVAVTTGGEGEIVRGRKLLSHGKVFVGGVPLGTSESELRAHFSRFGTVAFVGAPKNKQTGAARGFAFVQFVNPDDAAAAIAAGPDRNVIRGTTVYTRTPQARSGPDRSHASITHAIFSSLRSPSGDLTRSVLDLHVLVLLHHACFASAARVQVKERGIIDFLLCCDEVGFLRCCMVGLARSIVLLGGAVG
jgi:hypothetical protein